MMSKEVSQGRGVHIKKEQEKKQRVYVGFMDFEKAYDRVKHKGEIFFLL